jgi:hypothetical protein
MNPHGSQPTRLNQNVDDDWDFITSPAVRELLDHLAQELAAEYIRLSEEAASDENYSERELKEHAFGGHQS